VERPLVELHACFLLIPPVRLALALLGLAGAQPGQGRELVARRLEERPKPPLQRAPS